MNRTVQDIIDHLVAPVPQAPLPDTVDTLKCGNPSQRVTGIVTCFIATMEVLQKAVERRANLIISHEDPFYDHYSQTDWLGNDQVYQTKRAFAEQHGLSIWRFHDYWHRYQPDGIYTGMIQALEWQPYQQSEEPRVFIIPDTTVATLATMLKAKLGLSAVRVVGNLQQRCERIGLLVGAIGGRVQIQTFERLNVDVVVCGETEEWRTEEYARDALTMGHRRALLIIGHAKSEEEGMRYLVDWLQPQMPDIPMSYIAVGNPMVTI